MEVYFNLPQGLGAHMRAKHGVVGGGPRRERNQRYQAKRKERLAAEKEELPESVGLAPPIPEPEQPAVAAAANGSGEIGAAISSAFAPLEEHYLRLQSRQAELADEQAQVDHDLHELWAVLEGRGTVTAPPTIGVQVAFQKSVSDSLTQRAEGWLANRRTSFTVADLARGIACGHSTAANLVSLLRDQSKVRLVGKKGNANAYASTIGGG